MMSINPIRRGRLLRAPSARAGERARQPAVFKPAAVLTLALLVSLAVGDPERSISVRVWLVAVGAVVVRRLVAAIGGHRLAGRSDAFDALVGAPGPRPQPEPPQGLKEATRLLELGSGTAADLHFRVRPVLREVAAQRLATHHGLALDDPRDAAAVVARCGPVLWDLVRAERPTPADRGAPALDPGVVVDLVQTLETL